MRVVVDVLLLLPALLYQNTLAAHFQVRGVGLDLIAVLLATMSLVQGWLYGAVCGLVCGLIMDGVFGLTGYHALGYMMLGMVVGLAGEKFRLDNWIGPALALFVAYLLKEMIPIVYLYFARLVAASMFHVEILSVCISAQFWNIPEKFWTLLTFHGVSSTSVSLVLANIPETLMALEVSQTRMSFKDVRPTAPLNMLEKSGSRRSAARPTPGATS